jgi:hypothetical protein
MRATGCLALVALTACLLAGPPAFADSAADKAAADALFSQAKALMAAGKYAEACPKLEESQRLDPALGTQLNLADCYEHTGRTASAWGLFNEVARASEKRGDKERAAEAARRAAVLAPTLQKLAIVVPPATRVTGLEVRKDGELVGEGSWGSALPTDPGAHTIEASAPAHKAWSTVVRVETSGAGASVEIPRLEALAGPPGVGTLTPFWGPQRIAGAAVGGVGLVGLVVGAAFGVVTFQKTSDAKPYCSATLPYCTQAGITLENDAKTTANVSNAAFAIGGAAVVAGLVTFFTAPAGDSKPPSAVRVGPVIGQGRAGITVEGSW